MSRMPNPPLLETVTEINTYIDNQKYEVCRWALEVAPEAKECIKDCPFPFCVECDFNSKNNWLRPKYIEEFKMQQRGQLCL